MIRYCVHPGYVTSQHDADRHFVGGHELMRLYGVSPSECVIASPQYGWKAPADVIHLYPRNDGNYKLNPPN